MFLLKDEKSVKRNENSGHIFNQHKKGKGGCICQPFVFLLVFLICKFNYFAPFFCLLPVWLIRRLNISFFFTLCHLKNTLGQFLPFLAGRLFVYCACWRVLQRLLLLTYFCCCVHLSTCCWCMSTFIWAPPSLATWIFLSFSVFFIIIVNNHTTWSSCLSIFKVFPFLPFGPTEF